MFESTSPLSEGVRALVCTELVARVADATDLYNASKVAHWCVRGPAFVALHALFREVAAMASNHADVLAERAAGLGAIVGVTSQTVTARTRLEPYPVAVVSGTEHVMALASRMSAYASLLSDTGGRCDQEHDLVTVNLLTDAIGETEKLGWKLLAHTQAAS